MTKLITSDDWQSESIGEDYYDYAETSDPRVLAVIVRDVEASISELYDGDAINPIIYVSHRFGLQFSHESGYDGGEAALMQQAYDQWGWDGTARRWLWIFHGIAAENAPGGYDRDGNWIVATSHSFRDHIEAERHTTYGEARQDCETLAKDLSDALDGNVYGVGYATFEERVLADDEDIDLTEWEIDIQCWGFVGEGYARRSAADFEHGEPDLPEMLVIERAETPAEATTGVSGEW
jgi:hypothetical protein